MYAQYIRWNYNVEVQEMWFKHRFSAFLYNGLHVMYCAKPFVSQKVKQLNIFCKGVSIRTK